MSASDGNAAVSSGLSREAMLDLYRTMLTIRLVEEQLVRAHQRGLVPGACHAYIGQEAVAAGVCSCLRPTDVVFSTHRGHGHALAKGVAPRSLIAEVLGRATGCSGGRGGSMHIFAPEVGMMGTSGIVGPCILQAAGAAYAFKLDGSDRVSVAFFGDGASNNGAFHEGLNMAGIWKLPVVFVCENNLYATEVPIAYSGANPNIAERATAYNLPGVSVDGNDVLAVRGAAEEAVRRARSGGGPTLIECRTYRTRPHGEGMGDFTYRTREEVDAWKARCPVQGFRRRLLLEKIATEEEIAVVEDGIRRAVAEAMVAAESDPLPDPSDALRHVYDEAPPAVARPAPPASGTERRITFIRATLEALSAEMDRNPAIYVMGEGIGRRGGNFATTTGLYDKHGPVRLCDTPIAERGFTGMAAGAAMAGARPVIDFMFLDFELDAAGEIINQIAKIHYMSNGRLRMPVLLRGCIGTGHSAGTHHSGNYLPTFAHFPGLRVVVPSTPYDAKGLLARALRCRDPVLFLEHRELLAMKGPVPEEDYEIEFGKAAVVREGRHVTVVALALMVHHTLAACAELAAGGIDVEVIDPRTISPLDAETILASVRKTGRLLVVDEDFAPFSFGSEVAALAAGEAFDDLDAPVRRLHGEFAPTPYSRPLEEAVVPNPARIVRAVRELMAE
ncbi:MAG: dehydrogenase E1 component subunit alpha/beta [Planctomycetota bacterium]|nr:dehydrogenase E1 component subunit alpha/beta [Planctomycetota bacterium]